MRMNITFDPGVALVIRKIKWTDQSILRGVVHRDSLLDSCEQEYTGNDIDTGYSFDT